jgi:hypothetical protein
MFTFILAISVQKFRLLLRGRRTIQDPKTGRTIATEAAISADFKNGQFVTDDAGIAQSIREHKLFNRGFGQYILEIKPEAKAVNDDLPTGPIDYDDMTTSALRKLCEERGLKSYGSKGEMAGRLKEADEKFSDPDCAEYAEKIAAAYLKADLVRMATEAGVETKAAMTEREIVLAMLAAGVEIPLVG